MNSEHKQSRRKILKTGLCVASAAAAATVLDKPDAHAQTPAPKAPGETKIVVMMGHDGMHNDVSYEMNIRSIFSSKRNWRIWAARTNKVITPELINDADLIMTQRFGDPYEWNPSGLADSTGRERFTLYNDVMAEAIIDNVENRGMGWMAIHNTVWNGRKDLEDFLDVDAELHQEIQPVIYKDLRQDHPITQGIEPFFINLEEQFGVKIKTPSKTTVLFRSLAVHDKRDSVGGWCLERGKGKIVGLLPGHLEWAYGVREYAEIFWRSAFWAMSREIEPYPG
ncbi:ThuA domain-containing protein [Candidatus Latescibacterota bacterium]